MKKKDYLFYAVIIAFIMLFLASAVIFKEYNVGALPVQFYGALIGVFITAIVTAFLLRGQTEGDEKREKSVKVFEKKQEIYHDFLRNLKEIIKAGDITIYSQGKGKDSDDNVDDLKDLLFELGYIQMHTTEENANNVFERVSKIIQQMNDFNSAKDKEKSLSKFYASISEELFGIISILKNDLYGIETNTIPKYKIEGLFRECDLFIDTDEEFSKYDLQNYFWDELQKQLKEKGYGIVPKDFREDVSEYYARAKNRHRYYEIAFPVYTTQSGETVHFTIGVENDYYYGFKKPEYKKENPELIQAIRQVSSSFKQTDWWYGFKYSDRNRLDFWSLDSQAFERLKNPLQREQFIAEIAEEMDIYIKKFTETARQNNL